MRKLISPSCKRQNCDECEVFNCGHTCHSALEDSGPDIEESFNGFDNDDEEADGITLEEVEE